VNTLVLDIVTDRPQDAGDNVFYACWIDCKGKHRNARKAKPYDMVLAEVLQLSRKYPETRYFVMRRASPAPPGAAHEAEDGKS